MSLGLAALASFTVLGRADAAAPVTAQVNLPETETATAVLQETGEEMQYNIVDGMAVIEGDILVGTHAEVQKDGIDHPTIEPDPTCPEGQQCGVILTSSRRKWPNGVVPYTLAPGTSDSARQVIQDAINEWETKTSIRFVQRSNERDYVEFVGTGRGYSCSSWLGRAGGRQAINYSGNGRGCMVHEIGHAVGLSHEQNRNDRDEYINIDFSNIVSGGESQFRKASGSTDVGPYDFNSVMHYSAYSFARDRSRPVISAKDGRDPRTIGGRDRLTDADVQGIEYVYGSSPNPPTTQPPTTQAPTTQAPTTQAPTTQAPTTQAPTTQAPTPTDAPTTTTSPTPTSEGPSTTEASTTTQPPTTGAPTTQPPDPSGDAKPVIEFASVKDGQTVATRIPYGGINIKAHDPDAGTADGSGIRWVTLVLSDAETGRFLGARREYWTTYDWGLRLRENRSYRLTAYAVSERSAGGGWSMTSITINTGGTTPPSTTAPPTTALPTTQVPTTQVPTTQVPTSGAPTTAAPTSMPSTTVAPTTVAPTTVAPDPGPGDGESAIHQEVLRLTNAERAKAGCQALTLDPTLTKVADAHTADMAANGYFSHQGRDGSWPWDRVKAAGYQANGSSENIAQGYSNAAGVVQGWMQSTGHRRNMLNCKWTEMGVGYTKGGKSESQVLPIYWAQVFAVPAN